ncbi:MAG: ankyrin repeat domain-containing protein [Alphaproteobacteria bacterium]
MILDYSHCPAADQKDEAKKARTEEFFELAEKDTTTDAQLTELVKQGVCLEARDNNGFTALILAAIYGHTDTARALLTAGAEIEARDVWGNTALMRAANKGRTATLQVLLAAGAESEARDNDGYTPLHRAARNGRTATARALLAAGAESEARDNDGFTALHWAAINGRTATLQALLARGANIYAQANNGKRPIDEPVVSTHAESLQRGYAKFVASGKPPENAAAVYRLLAATPLLDDTAPVDRLGNLTRIMAHAQWADKTRPAEILSELAAEGSITPEQARSIYQHHIAAPAAKRTQPQSTGRGR